MSKITKIGFIDKTGKIVIPPMDTVTSVHGFSDGLAVFTSPQDKMGAINKSGEVVIQPIYDYFSLYDFKNGRAIFKEGDVYGLLDAAGNVVVEPIYKWLEGPDEFGNYKAMRGSLVGFIDRDGNVVIDFKFERGYIDNFVDGYATACSDAGWGFIDNTGKWVIAPQYRYAGDFGEGLAPVKVNDTLWQYINIKNEVQFEVKTSGRWDGAESFKGGIAFVHIDKRFRPINKKGEFINGTRYCYTDDHNWEEGPRKVQVSENTPYRFLKPDGKHVKFEGMKAKDRVGFCSFRDGLFRINNIVTETAHFYDVNGKIFPTPELKFATYFSEGLAICTTADSQDIIIDREGNIVCALPKIADSVVYGCFSEGLAWFKIDEEV